MFTDLTFFKQVHLHHPLGISDITKNSCRLSWKPPKETGGAKISSYVIERQEVGKPYWVTVFSHCKVSVNVNQKIRL